MLIDGCESHGLPGAGQPNGIEHVRNRKGSRSLRVVISGASPIRGKQTGCARNWTRVRLSVAAAGTGARMSAAKDDQQHGESRRTILTAVGANVAVAVAKAVAAVLTGSAAMWAETAHSVADTGNEL